jgi:hypothetical protein
MVIAKSEALISYKIKQDGNDEFNYVLCDPWIESLLRHKLGNVKNIGNKCGFFLCLFRDKKLEGRFPLSLNTKVVGYLTLKKYSTSKSDLTPTIGSKQQA